MSVVMFSLKECFWLWTQTLTVMALVWATSSTQREAVWAVWAVSRMSRVRGTAACIRVQDKPVPGPVPWTVLTVQRKKDAQNSDWVPPWLPECEHALAQSSTWSPPYPTYVRGHSYKCPKCSSHFLQRWKWKTRGKLSRFLFRKWPEIK